MLLLHPDKQWAGGDVTWQGAHEFDASVDISGNVGMDGDLTIDGKIAVDSSADFSDVFVEGDISVAGSLAVATDFTLTGDMAVDGTVNFGGVVSFGADISAAAQVTTFGANTNQDDEPTAMLKAHAYLANQDGFVTAFAEAEAGNRTVSGYVGATNDPAGAGDLVAQSNSKTTGEIDFISFPVASGKYFEIVANTTNAATIFWHPVGVLVKPTDQD